MGPGLIESIYEWCLEQEMTLRCIPVERQRTVTVSYKNLTREEPLRCDLLVANCLLVEVKATERILPIHKAQLLSYMNLLDVPIGLLMNFHVPRLADGTCRMILNGADVGANCPSEISEST